MIFLIQLYIYRHKKMYEFRKYVYSIRHGGLTRGRSCQNFDPTNSTMGKLDFLKIIYKCVKNQIKKNKRKEGNKKRAVIFLR